MGGNIIIDNNYSLTSLWGLENVNPGYIEELIIINNPFLTTCDIQSICEYLANPGAVVQISNNAPGCDSVEELTEVCESHCLYNGITFNSQEELDNFQSNYPNCSKIDGDVLINGDDIINLNGLDVLASIGGDLHIGWMMGTSLINLSGLDNLTYIEGDLIIRLNASLSSLTGLENVTTIGEDLNVYYNHDLINLTGLEKLNSIGGDLFIRKNNTLIDFNGLDALTSIGGRFRIWDNNSLTSFSGTETLTSIGENLEIYDNSLLLSLTGLDNINPASINNLFIYNNDSLSFCAAKSICDYLVSPNGNIVIHSNAPGCNSQEEIEAACDTVSVLEIIFEETFTISPNPLESGATIKYFLHQSTPVSLKILELSGRIGVTLVNEFQQQGEQNVLFNTSGLPAGIYFCVLKTNQGIQTIKMIKL